MSVRIRALGVYTVVAGLVVGCLGEDAPGDGGGALSGTWVLPESVWLGSATSDIYDRQISGSTSCRVEMTGSRGSVDCDATVSGRSFYDDGPVGATVTVSATIEVREASIAAEGVRTITTRYAETEFSSAFVTTCTESFSGSADRDAGRESAGRFSALAGNWLGRANTNTQCDFDGNPYSTASAWQFTADLFGEHATVEGQPLGGGATSTWLMQNSPQGMVVQRLGSDDGAFAEEID